MADDQDPKQPAPEKPALRLSDLKGQVDLGKLPDVIRASETLAAYNRRAELALGSTFRDLQANADRYRALLEPSPAMKAAIAGMSINQDLIRQARLAVDGGILNKLRAPPNIHQMPEQQTRLSASFRVNSESLKYIQDQIDIGRVSQLSASAQQIANLRAADIERFRLPAAAISAAQFQALDHDRLYATSKLLRGDYDRIAQAAAGLKSPWLDATNSAVSLARFSKLHNLGAAIRLESAYSDEVSSAIRASLGDWRERISQGLSALSDLSVRTDFYVERGLDRELTDLPEEAFEETLDVTEIRNEPPPLVELYGSPNGTEEDPEVEAGFRRNNQAHDWLQRFETQIRHFVDDQMTRRFGENWPTKRLPNDMLDKWLEKRRKDPNQDRHRRVIVYADFTDYERIICKTDNFKEVFAPFFNRTEHFRESMQRLAVPRIEVMHARIITQDDELYLFTELRRLTNQFMRRH